MLPFIPPGRGQGRQEGSDLAATRSNCGSLRQQAPKLCWAPGRTPCASLLAQMSDSMRWFYPMQNKFTMVYWIFPPRKASGQDTSLGFFKTRKIETNCTLPSWHLLSAPGGQPIRQLSFEQKKQQQKTVN